MVFVLLVFGPLFCPDVVYADIAPVPNLVTLGIGVLVLLCIPVIVISVVSVTVIIWIKKKRTAEASGRVDGAERLEE